MSATYLPDDIIELVFLRLPIKSLCKFKCISKYWNFEFSSHKFFKAHLNTSKKPQKMLLLSKSEDCEAVYSVDLDERNPKAEELCPLSYDQFSTWSNVSGVFDGLMMVFGDSGGSNFFLNPFTRQRENLPQLSLSKDFLNSACGFGYDPATDDYKAVIVFHANLVGYDVAVFSWKDWRIIEGPHKSWRIIVAPHNSLVPDGGVYHLGLLYWFHGDDDKKAIAFDLSHEIFREIYLPDSEAEPNYLCTLRDCLCLVSNSDSGIEIWLMGPAGLWRKDFSIYIPNHMIEEVLCEVGEKDYLLTTFGRVLEVNEGLVVDESSINELLLYTSLDEILYTSLDEMVSVVAVNGLPRRFGILRNYTLLSLNRHVMDDGLEPLSIQTAERYQVLALMDFTQPIFRVPPFKIKLWPPGQNTRSMLVQQITNDLSSQSVFTEEFGSLNEEEAGENAKEIEDSAFASASEHYAMEPDDFGSSAVQLYAKECGKRILEVLTRTKENAELAGPHDDDDDDPDGL